MFQNRFGIEVEFTGISRQRAAEVAAKHLEGTVRYVGGNLSAWEVVAPDGRRWRFVYDASVSPQKKVGRRIVDADNDFKVEMVSPILTYREDIGTIQALVRLFRKEGGFPPDNAGIHIHLDGAPHTPRSVCNFLKIIASKNNLLYKALRIKPDRMRYCKKLDEYLIRRIEAVRPRTFDQIEEIWYRGYNGSRTIHYHESRYYFAQLHSFFTGNHTIELRGFNAGDSKGNLHAGLVRSYIVLALALNHQALSQKSASSRVVQAENEKFAMRTYLNRIGFIGDEFKSCREHLCKHLDGNGAWRFGHDLRLDRDGGDEQ